MNVTCRRFEIFHFVCKCSDVEQNRYVILITVVNKTMSTKRLRYPCKVDRHSCVVSIDIFCIGSHQNVQSYSGRSLLITAKCFRSDTDRSANSVYVDVCSVMSLNENNSELVLSKYFNCFVFQKNIRMRSDDLSYHSRMSVIVSFLFPVTEWDRFAQRWRQSFVCIQSC